MSDVSRETTLKPGDVVVLNSGGPRMTVTRFDNNGVLCAWMNGDLQQGWTSQISHFPIECLTPVQVDSKPSTTKATKEPK